MTASYCNIGSTPCWGTLGSGEAYMVSFIDGNGKGKFAINVDIYKKINSWARHIGNFPTDETVKYAINILKEKLNKGKMNY